MDCDYGRVEGLDFANALTVLATVISHTRPDRAVVDAGHKASSIDAGMPALKDLPGARYVKATDEHGTLVLAGEATKLKIGDRVELLPSHCDPTINLHDAFHVVRDGRLEAVWPIAARGALR
jgi:D-serine deaminase-like pyridoxal phosphate-dependent protein